MAQADFVERTVGDEASGQRLGLINLGRARAEVWAEPDGYEVVFIGNVLDFEDDGDAHPSMRTLKRGRFARGVRSGGAQINVTGNAVGFGGFVGVYKSTVGV